MDHVAIVRAQPPLPNFLSRRVLAGKVCGNGEGWNYVGVQPRHRKGPDVTGLRMEGRGKKIGVFSGEFS